MREYTGSARGTCGELVQGFTSDKKEFHVSLPIQKFSNVTLQVQPANKLTIITPSNTHSKLVQALHLTANLLHIDSLEIKVSHHSELRTGKGMGSSTADIVAASRALAKVIGYPISPAQLATIATSIESSDASMYDAMVAFRHKEGSVLSQFEWWPQFVICMVLPPYSRDTDLVNFEGKENLGDQFDELLKTLEMASKKRDPAPFAFAATQSAIINQKFSPNPLFPIILEHLSELKALGICIGHTGTVIGLLYDASTGDAVRTALEAKHILGDLLPKTATLEVTTSV